jgi:predicted CoA-binding protein
LVAFKCSIPAAYDHFITQIMLGILEQARAWSVPAIWLQPGAEDENVLAWIHENGMDERVIYGGPCILVDGDGIAKSML